MTVNADLRRQEGQVPDLIIFSTGCGRGHLADQKMEGAAGMSGFDIDHAQRRPA